MSNTRDCRLTMPKKTRKQTSPPSDDLKRVSSRCARFDSNYYSTKKKKEAPSFIFNR
jgi:hypothetical protein